MMMTNGDSVSAAATMGGAGTHRGGAVDVMAAAPALAPVQQIDIHRGGGGTCNCDCGVADPGPKGRDVESSPCPRSQAKCQQQHQHRHQRRMPRGREREDHEGEEKKGHFEFEDSPAVGVIDGEPSSPREVTTTATTATTKRASFSSLALGMALASQPWETIGILDELECEGRGEEGGGDNNNGDDCPNSSSGNNNNNNNNNVNDNNDTPPTFDEMVGRVSAVLEHRLTEVVLDRKRSQQRRPSFVSCVSRQSRRGVTSTTPQPPHPSENENDKTQRLIPPTLPLPCRAELREFVRRIGFLYRDCKYHRFEHAVHVTVSANKLLHLLEEGGRLNDDRHPCRGGDQDRVGGEANEVDGRRGCGAANHGGRQHIGEGPYSKVDGSCTLSATTASTTPMTPSESSLPDVDGGSVSNPSARDCQDSRRDMQHNNGEPSNSTLKRTDSAKSCAGSSVSSAATTTTGGTRRRPFLPAAGAIDPLSKFCLVFSALVHDVDHQGVPNAQLTRERDELAVLYDDASVAEQHSIKVAFGTLMLPDFAEFRRTLLPTSADQFAFRMRVIDLVMCTDIASPERMRHARAKWSEAFEEDHPGLSSSSSSSPHRSGSSHHDDSANLRVSTVTASRPKLVNMRRNSNPLLSSSSSRTFRFRRGGRRGRRNSLSADILSTSLDTQHHFNRRGGRTGADDRHPGGLGHEIDSQDSREGGDTVAEEDEEEEMRLELQHLKASVILETMMNAADVAHTLQSFQNFLKWNRRLYEELFVAYVSGRTEHGCGSGSGGGGGMLKDEDDDDDDDDDHSDDPAKDWYKNQLFFYDIYILPLARKLMQCGAFGDVDAESGDGDDEHDREGRNNNQDLGQVGKAGGRTGYGRMLVDNALEVRRRWEEEGEAITADMIDSVRTRHREEALARAVYGSMEGQPQDQAQGMAAQPQQQQPQSSQGRKDAVATEEQQRPQGQSARRSQMAASRVFKSTPAGLGWNATGRGDRQAFFIDDDGGDDDNYEVECALHLTDEDGGGKVDVEGPDDACTTSPWAPGRHGRAHRRSSSLGTAGSFDGVTDVGAPGGGGAAQGSHQGVVNMSAVASSASAGNSPVEVPAPRSLCRRRSMSADNLTKMAAIAAAAELQRHRNYRSCGSSGICGSSAAAEATYASPSDGYHRSNYKGDCSDGGGMKFLPHRARRYLPKILREMYACQPVTASAITTNSADPSCIRRQQEQHQQQQQEHPLLVSEGGRAALELRLRLRRPKALPAHRDLRGTVLILDLSGFTALGERLKHELGDSEGAAEFAQRVNVILSTMVERVYEFGGDVLMFAGDALICLFEEAKKAAAPVTRERRVGKGADDAVGYGGRGGSADEATLSRVRECCLRVLGEVAWNNEGSLGSGGDDDFTLHGGACHGLVRCLFLGQPSSAPGDCAFIVSGLPLLRAGKLLNRAGEGEILIDGFEGPITEEAGKRCFFQQRGSNNSDGGGGTTTSTAVSSSESKNRGNLKSSFAQESAMAVAVTSSPSSPAADMAGYNIHPFARAYLGTLAARRSDHAEGNAMSMLLNELRPVAIVFVGLHDLNNIARDTKLLHLMNSAFVSLSRITYGCNGAVRDMLCDDKGCVFISVFGAHSHEVNPCFDATVCAMRMQEALDELSMRHFSLGVSFGDCFCGEVGPSIRADYVVMGTEVNMAARLMGKAPNRGILASKRVYTNSKKFIQFAQSEHLKVKGKDGFFHAYIPQARVVRGNNLLDDGTHQQPFILLPSRELEMMKMLNALHEADDGQPKVLTMCGGPFLGKSRMIRSLGNKATAANFTVLKSFRTSLDSFTSYYPFRQIVLTALQRCASALLGVQTEHEVSAMGVLIEDKVLNKSDRVILGSILPTVADAQLLSLLRGQNPKALTKSIVDALMKLIAPLQPAMLVFEGDGEIDPSSWSLISEMMQRATTECPRLLLVIISRNALTMPSSVSHLQRYAEHAKLAPLDKYETEIYLEVLLGIHDKGIGVDQKLLDAVHDRANGCPSFIEFIVSWALGKSMIEYIDSKNVMSLNLPVAPSEDVTTAIPRELSSIVLASFNDLPPILWDVLKIASCIGYSFDANLYEALDGDLDFMPKIEELATSYDVFERSDGCRYKWKHQAVYEAVKSLLINNQRVQIHSMIAEVFERRNKDKQYSDMVKGDMHRLLARHCALADKWDGAFRQYMEAGKRAEETYNFPEAAKMYEEAISCQEKMTSKVLLRSRLLPTVRLGNCLRELARYNDAESVLKECLCEAENAMNESDADEQMYVHALTALAALNQAQSKYSEARQLYEKALPIARNMQESRSSLCLSVHIAGYAETLRKSGDLPSAETLHWEALHIRSITANEGGCTALEMAVSYTQLGCTLFGRGKYKEAYKQHRSALTSRFELLDFSHGLVSESLNYCAEALCALGRGGDGIPLAMHAVIIRKVVFGVSHPAYAHALSVLASCYHAIGRSCDARDCLEECLAICEGAFPKNHANIIPNLMNYGKVLCSTGEHKKARDVYERAIVIHQTNFKEGQRAVELEKCQSQVRELSIEIDRSTYDKDGRNLCDCEGGVGHEYVPIPTVDVESGRTPIIVLTDIGRDVDDEYALVLLAALKSMDLLDPIAVVATLSPERERAHLARGVLDIMGLPDVPVGIGSAGGAKLASALDVYGAEYSRSCSCIFDNGVELMARALASSPDKSVQLLIISSLTDAATLAREYEELFVSKVKEVIVMGGLNKLDRAERIAPDTAYNNNCDTAAAAFVYERCQELGVPTLTLSRFAAYGCPVPTAVLDELKKTEHMVANNIRDVSLSSINQLWTKVNLPPSDTRREKLPPRCDRQWFCDTFMGKEDIDRLGSTSIWSHVKKLNMYDPLALLCCVPAYREVHFQRETKTVKSVPHSIIGISEVDTGIIDAESLCSELYSLFRLAFLNSLQNICTRRVRKQRTSMDF